MYLITVVRDFEFYDKYVKNNCFNFGAEFVAYDNTKENIGIAKRYNDFLDNYDYDDEQWFCFCHEDWQPLEEYISKTPFLDKGCIYGTLGTIIKTKPFVKAQKKYIGQIYASNKDGSGAGILGKHVKTGTNVETFDCMAVFIHSSLVKKYHIRFDENLDWHHYAEELCIRLREKYKIKAKIFQIKCKHWSYGVSLPNTDFLNAFNYVKNKFKETKRIYSNTTIDEVIGKLNKSVSRVYNEPYKMVSFPNDNIPLFQHKASYDNKHHAYYVCGLNFVKIYPNKMRFCLFGLPLMTFERGDKYKIKLLAIVPIFLKTRKNK